MVTRLPRLIQFVKSQVRELLSKSNASSDEPREIYMDNMTFTTYNNFMETLVKTVNETIYENDNLERTGRMTFVEFLEVRYDCSEKQAKSFKEKFFECNLTDSTKKRLKDASIEPLTLWQAIINVS